MTTEDVGGAGLVFRVDDILPKLIIRLLVSLDPGTQQT
jgi:hypothetical protein